MANTKTTGLTENTSRHFNDLLYMVDDPAGTPLSQKMKFLNATGLIVNAQTGTTYTYLTGDYGTLVTHTNASAIAGTLPQAGASFPANWFMLVQNRGAGALTITPTTSTIDGASTLVLNQNEGATIVSDGINYFTLRGKATGAAGVGDVVGPGSATDNALVRFDSTTGKLIQNSTVTLDDTGALTVPEMAAPATPATGKVTLYAKTDGLLYSKDDAGVETVVTGGGSGVATLDDLSDVVITSPAADEVIKYNGSSWVNSTVLGGSGPFASGSFEQFKLMAVQVPPGSSTNSVYGGMGSSPIVFGSSSNQDDADGHWIRRTTGASINGQAAENANLGNLTRVSYLPQLNVKFKTHSSIAVCRLWVGFFSGSPMGSDDPALHGMAFRYATATDGTAFWRTWTNDGLGGGTATTTSQSIATSTIYHLVIKVVSTSSIEFYISTDGGVTYTLVATHTTNLPATGMDYYCGITTLENVDKAYQHSWTQIRQR